MLKDLQDFAGDQSAPATGGKDSQFVEFSKRVGPDRARAAMSVMGQRNGRATLPELLAHAYLDHRNLQHDWQVELGICRPDEVVFDYAPFTTVQQPQMHGDDGKFCICWFIQGDYWHSGKEQHDESKARAIIGQAWQGFVIADVVMVWESDIYRNEHVFDDALARVRWRGF